MVKIEKAWIHNTIKLFFPIVLGLGTIGLVCYLMKPSLRAEYFSLVSAYFFPPLGKESVIPLGVLRGIHPLVMALSIAFVDFIVALFLVWNYDYAKGIPLIGKFMDKVEKIGKTSSNKYSWVEPLRFIGIVLFVMIPFQGSGGLVGSIVGRLIGMNPWHTVLAITIGAVIGTTIIAYSADSILSVLNSNIFGGILILIILIISGILIYIYMKTNKKKKEKNSE